MKKKKQIQGIFFDLDGTIIDTELTAATTLEKIFQEWSIDLHSDDSSFVTGRTWESAFQYLFKKYKLPISPEEAKLKILTQYRENLQEHLPTVPGSVEAVQALSAHFPLALVSGSSRRDILWALKTLKIDSHFQVILGAEDYPRSKPEPDGYLKAMDSMKLEPHSGLVFEDSTAGVASALQANLWVVAITSTNHFNQETSQAHFKIQDLRGIDQKWVDHLRFE
jgi:HAD superfamily hydrolase (TIGR01509 family)